MLSNGAWKTRNVLKLDNVTALECILSIAVTMVHYWIMAIFLCLTCMRDFCEIFIFTTSKIVERVIWTFEIAGFEQINEKICSLVSSRGGGTQTDLSFRNVAEQPVPIIKLTHATVTVNEKETQTSPPPILAYGQDFTFLQQNNTSKHDLSWCSVCSQDFPVLQHSSSKHEPSRSSAKQESSRSSPKQESSSSSPKLESSRSSPKQESSRSSPKQESSRSSPKQESSRSSVSSQDLTLLQQNIPIRDVSRSSSCTQDFTFLEQNNIPKYLNMFEEVEKLTPAVINVDNFKPSPLNVQHMSQSPVCTVHMTPCSTNLKARYSKVVVDSMSPEEISYLRRKWNTLKKNKKRSYLKMEPIFPNNVEDSSNERRPKKLRMMIDGDNTESVNDVESPEMKGCYKNLLLKLKSKFTHRNDSLVSYTNL